MSTHNIGFNEDLTKIIFELSSNIIKYAPYFFCCIIPVETGFLLTELVYKPRCEKTGLRGFRPGQTQSWLYSYRRCLEA